MPLFHVRRNVLKDEQVNKIKEPFDSVHIILSNSECVTFNVVNGNYQQLIELANAFRHKGYTPFMSIERGDTSMYIYRDPNFTPSKNLFKQFVI